MWVWFDLVRSTHPVETIASQQFDSALINGTKTQKTTGDLNDEMKQQDAI